MKLTMVGKVDGTYQEESRYHQLQIVVSLAH